MNFKPMLASPADLDKIQYPIYASPKLDGIRASVVGGRLLSRTLKEIPSHHIYNMFNQHKFEGLDGELIVGDPTSPTCYRDTVSGVMADHKQPEFHYHVFDYVMDPDMPFKSRLTLLNVKIGELKHGHIKLVNHRLLNDRQALDKYEAEQVALGHEGIMLASPDAAYKFGRATTKGGELLKVKRFEDSEAVVLGIVEEEFNGNEAETNELGRTKRSSAKAGKVGKGSMGALFVRDWKTKVEFHIGTGFTAADRAAMWAKPPIGDTIKYKSFPIGVKDKPRHPVFLGFRPVGA
jgi:DNA ligase-1